jgi:hypothetical protein
MAYSISYIEQYDTFANLPAVGTAGQMYWTYDTSIFWIWAGASYTSLPTVGGAPRVVASVGGSATPSINVATTDMYEVTALAQAITGVTLTGSPVDGQVLKFRFKDSGVSRAITFGASFLASGTVALLTTTVTPKTHMQNFQYDSGRALWIATFVDATGY